MNCPICNTPGPDGKKYCAECGAPLDPQTKYLESAIHRQIEDEIEKRFKDRNLVDVETTQAIAARLLVWVKMFAYPAGVVIALCVILLGFFGIERYSDLNTLVTNVEKDIKPKVVQATSDAEQAQKIANEAKAEAEDSKKTIEAATTEAKRQLGSATELAGNVRALSVRVSGLEQRTSSQINDSSKRVDARVAELDQKIDAATRDISEQQQKLASTDVLVKALFSKGTTEYFETTANGPNVLIVPMPKGNGAMVFMLLKSAPIYQTIEVKWRVFSQPRASYIVTNNVLRFVWGDPADNLKQNPLEVTYVPDPTSISPVKALSVRGNSVFADETKIMDLPMLN
jgi:hypothetical protein